MICVYCPVIFLEGKRLAKVTSIRKCHAFVNNYFTKVLTMVKTFNSFEGLGLTKFNVEG